MNTTINLKDINLLTVSFKTSTNEKKSFELPFEVVKNIFSSMTASELNRMKRICKAAYAAATDPHLPCYSWILRSEAVKQFESQKPHSTQMVNYSSAMREYAYRNHFELFCQRLEKVIFWHELVLPENLLILELAVEQGSKQAAEILFSIYYRMKDVPESFFAILKTKRFAEAGNKKAIKVLLNFYRFGGKGIGLDASDPMVQKEGLRLAHHFADRGFESAIHILLRAYLKGEFGLKARSASVQKEGLALVTKFANQGIEKAIAILIKAFLKGRFGMDPVDPNSKQFLNLIKFYADKGSETARRFLLDYYFRKNPKSQEFINLTNHYAKLGSQEAISFQVKNHFEEFFSKPPKEGPFQKQELKNDKNVNFSAKLVLKQVNAGCEKAIDMFLYYCHEYWWMEKNYYETACYFAERRSEKAIKRKLNYDWWKGSVLDQAKRYVSRGSLTASRFLVKWLNERRNEF